MEKPQSIVDLVENMPEHIQTIRDADKDDVMGMLKFWEDYAKETVRNLPQNMTENKKLITQITDTLYRKMWDLGIVDPYTNFYISSVLYELFWQLGQKDIHVFYVLDNSMSDDYLLLLLQQLPPAGFAVITPHITDKLEWTPTNTLTHNLSYEEVEIKINEALKKNCKNILYIERDSSVDYLDKVAQLAKKAGDEYAKIYRNSGYKSPEIHNIENITKIGTIK